MADLLRPRPKQPILGVTEAEAEVDPWLQYDLNQVLVNKYENSATLPPHSDDEGSIKPDSSIFTVSLGSSGKIEFSHMSSGDKQELAVEPNSLYSMTRQSQKFYKHHVLPNNSDNVRYIITLRCVHWTNFNSTYAVGDSNFGGLEFGSGRGKVGTVTPGFRDWAACETTLYPQNVPLTEMLWSCVGQMISKSITTMSWRLTKF